MSARGGPAASGGRMPRSLLAADEARRSGVAREPAFLAKGFRPFFLLAAVFASAIVPLWLLIVFGFVRATAYTDATTWHAHEMVFGFGVAVIAGFLLTAVGNWTGRETVTGRPLAGLALLWAAGRAALLVSSTLPKGVAALVDLAFLPALILVLARPLVATKNKRNLVMPLLLSALLAANVVVHIGAAGVVSLGAARQACRVAIDVVLVIVTILAGRVFPMFTRNATGVSTIRSIAWLDRPAILGMVAVAAVDAIAPSSAAGAALSFAAGIASAARAATWGTRHTRAHPLLWILHAGYAWLPVGLLLRGLSWAAPASVPAALATHALTVGVIGSLTLGMMARVALGHTGRPLVAPRPMPWAFGAITLAAAVRALGPMVVPSLYGASLVAAGVLWMAAFGAYAVAYAPILLAPRADGRPG